MAATNQPPNGTRKSVTGFITKLVGDGGTFGFINDEIFFQQDVVTGGPVALNDRVFAECEYSENLPIKWNATSIKIIQRSGASPSGHASAGAVTNPLDSDPRRRQSLLNPQQQQQQPQQQQSFNQAPPQPVASTYQQHRQQMQMQQQQQQQQQQLGRPNPFDGPPNDQQQQQPMRLLDQQPPNVLGPNEASFFPGQPFAPQVGVPQAHDISPFQQPLDGAPMGPPKITYTSQLGAAFVQNQPAPLLPAPFMNQPSQPPMLPNQQQHNNKQQNRFEQNQRGNKMQDGGRQDNNRNNQRNNNQRNDHQARDLNKGDTNRNQSTRVGGDGGSRDRQAGRNASPRRDRNSRPSPPSHHPIRSRTSVSSERSGSHSNSKQKRRYEPHNIPRSRALVSLNSTSIVSRCSSSIHVPSDLKEIIVNEYFRLDIKNTPKPIEYRIETSLKETATDGSNDSKKDNSVVETSEINSDPSEKDTHQQITNEIATSTSNNCEATTLDNNSGASNRSSSSSSSLFEELKRESNSSSLITPPSSQPRSDIKLYHKYGVKVILISLPELESIFKRVFGNDLDSFTNDSTNQQPRLDECISLLCNKAPSNGGHSLIGGKFDPTLDGFVEGERNEFERHGRQPDLIATCRRVVLDQTGLDLGPCKSWTFLATFMYNNKTDYFSPKASVEYSYIYMPQIWTMASSKIEQLEKESMKMEDCDEMPVVTENNPEVIQVEQAGEVPTLDGASDDNTREVEMPTPDSAPVQAANESSLTAETLSELKVVDLKAELDKRAIKYKPNAKKAELVALLHETLIASSKQQQAVAESTGQAQDTEEPLAAPSIESQDVETGAVTSHVDGEQEQPAWENQDVDGDQIASVDAEVKVDSLETPTDQQEETQESKKRKLLDDHEEGNDASGDNKKPQIAELNQTSKKKQKVELIGDQFVVRPRDGQQQLAVVSLYDIIQNSRYDQFELSITSHLLKESLVQHLSEYILTTLVEDNRLKTEATISGVSSSSTNNPVGSQQPETTTTNSDTNNNTNSNNKTVLASKQPSTPLASSQTAKSDIANSANKSFTKEFPVDRYINLACCHFDSTHVGWLHADDLTKLFNNTGFSMSKRALNVLLDGGEKLKYRTLAELSSKSPPSCLYKFPEQLTRLPGGDGGSADDRKQEISSEVNSSSKMIQYQGVRYDLGHLIEQVREAEIMRVNLIERFNYAVENFDKQSEEVHLLEVNQKSLTNAIKLQQDEINELKRERDAMKKKCDQLRKGIKNSISSLNELVQQQQQQQQQPTQQQQQQQQKEDK